MRRSRYKVLLDGLRAELRGFQSDSVRRFIDAVAAALDAGEAVRVWGDESARKRKLLKLRAASRAFLRDGFQPALAQPYPKRINTEQPHTLAPLSKDAQRYYRAEQAAYKAVERYLYETNIALKSIEQPSRGQPSTDRLGVLTRVAHCYLEILGQRPTSTPGGSFSNIAALVMQYLSPRGQLPTDVSPQVRAALKAIAI